MAKVNKFLFWTPRILAILFILFLTMFSLDVFGNNYTFLELVLGLLVHNIPSIILLIALIISWKYEIVGGISFVLAGILYILLLIFSPNFRLFMLFWIVIISSPAFLIGILFLIGWKQKRKLSKKTRLNKPKRKYTR